MKMGNFIFRNEYKSSSRTSSHRNADWYDIVKEQLWIAFTGNTALNQRVILILEVIRLNEN